MAKVQRIGEQFRIATGASLDAVHRTLVSVAKREHAKIMAAAPQPAGFRRVVDGREGAPEEAVSPKGMIVYHYSRLDQVAVFAMDTLFDLSPVLSGAYRNSHTLFLNGAAVANLKDYAPGAEISISNPLPYSRKIELGKMKMRVSGTDEVYQRARTAIMRRFGNIVDVRFTYRSIHLPYIPGGANRAERKALKSQPARLSAMRLERETRVPVLILQER